MTSKEDQDPLGTSSKWEFQVKVETPDFEDLTSFMDENGQDNSQQDQGSNTNNDNYQGHMTHNDNHQGNTTHNDNYQGNTTHNDNYQGNIIHNDNNKESIVTIECWPDEQQQDSDYEPNSKKKKAKKKNKKPQKPWRSNKLYPCTECDYVANRYNNLTAHMGKHSDIKNLFCDFCPYSTRYKTSLRRHVKYQHVLNDAVEDCPWCEFKTSFKCNLKTHIQRLHSCTECQFKGSDDEVRIHFNETHATEKEALSRYILKTAKKIAKKISNIESDNSQAKSDHSDNENDIKSEEILNDDDDSEIDDSIFAPECEIMEISNVSQSEGDEVTGLQGGDAANEWNHRTTIKVKKKAPIEENKFSCSECEFTTRKRDNFVKHMQSLHDATFQIDCSYKCRHCDYSSRFKHNVRLHETKHTGEKIYKCTQCDYGTSYNTVFQRHQRKHAQKLLGPFLCDKCSFKTTTQGRLQYHMQRSHQIVNDTAHKCDFCDFYTDVKWRLNKHVNKSQSDGEILCPYCEFRSPYKCQMRMHKKEHLWILGGNDKVKSLRKSVRLSGFVQDGPVVDGCEQLEHSSGPLANDSEQLANDSEQLANNSGQQAYNSEQLANNSGQQAYKNEQQTYSSEQEASSGQQAFSSEQQAYSSEQQANNEEVVAKIVSQVTKVVGLNNSGQFADHCKEVPIEYIVHPSLTFKQTVEGSPLTEDCEPPTDNNGQLTRAEQGHFSDDSNSQSNYSEHNYTGPCEYQLTSMSSNVTQYDMTTASVSMSQTQNDLALSRTQNDLALSRTQNDLALSRTQNDMSSGNLFSYSQIEEQNASIKNSYTIDEGAMKLNEVRVGFDRSQSKPYSCFQCVYKAKYKAAVQRHYLRHHSSQLKPYKCKYCGFKTTTRDAMWKHTKRSQLLEVVNCECNQFSTRFRCELIKHRKTHNNFQCDLCSMSYRCRYDLERHIQNHPSPLYKCSVCSYCTVKEIFLLEHQAFHTGAKPYKCNVCSYSTVKELLLNLHRRKWHGHLCKVKKVKV